ncbi:MAG: PQQ-binding-like beta-propeller repeat protein [Gemmataceae bacterium]|nr:PQQ-binding-like beta-propeller repeat protein [Gemmataceae bacterium]
MLVRTTLAAAALAALAPLAAADDWPQWMGPKRDNVWPEAGILDAFPKDGPKVVWRAPAGSGYAGPAVAGGKVYVADFVTGEKVLVDNFARKPYPGTERVRCLDEATGKELWKHEYPVTTNVSYPSGPRCTPTARDGKVYTLGAMGNLIAFDAASGKVLWQHDLPAEYKTKPALWGYAAHPLIDGQKLITLAGGEGSHVVAFDKDTGKELWKAGTQKEQGYSPPTIIEAAGVRQLVITGPEAVRAYDPETGKQYWTTPYTATSGSIIMTPIKSGDHLYVGGYQGKSLLLKLKQDAPGVEVVFKDDGGMGLSPVNVQPFLDGDVMYGYDEGGNLRAVSATTGDRLWASPGPIGKVLGSGTAFLVKNGGRYFFFTEAGDLVIGTLSKEGYKEVSRAKLLDPTNTAGRPVVWSAPAYANKRVYARNDKELICVDLAK